MGTKFIAGDMDELIALRRDIHANPEIAFEETGTQIHGSADYFESR